MIAVGDTVFLFGGKVGSTKRGSNAAYKYNIASDTWTPIANLKNARYVATVNRLSDNEIMISGKKY